MFTSLAMTVHETTVALDGEDITSRVSGNHGWWPGKDRLWAWLVLSRCKWFVLLCDAEELAPWSPYPLLVSSG